MVNIQDCPYCKHNAGVTPYKPLFGELIEYRVMCLSEPPCYCGVAGPYRPNPEEAIEEWNKMRLECHG